MALSNVVDNGRSPLADGASVQAPITERPDPVGGPSAVVDLDAVAHNVGVLREYAGAAAVMVVVKADGYNHGAVEVGRTALAAGADELGVTTIAEAVVLRQAGITAPILSWLHVPGTDFTPAVRHDVELGLSSIEQLSGVIAAARSVGRTAQVTLKVDTGLNRNGISVGMLDDVLRLLAPAVAEGAVRLRGMFSHLACADVPEHPANGRQANVLRESVARAIAAGVGPDIVHLANSAATVTRPDLHFDMVRPGIAAYGLSPIPELGNFALKPVMTVSAPVALVKKVAAGESVSYGHTWTAEQDTVVGLVPMGYADGVRRNLSGRFDVSIGGRRFPAVGRVCMDQFVVDLGPDGGGVVEGDRAVLFGTGVDGEPVAQEWADSLDTIHYEVVTGIGGRTRRSHVGDRDRTEATGGTVR